MWTPRRGAIHLKNQGLRSGTARIICGKSEISRCYLENCTTGFTETQEKTFNGLRSGAARIICGKSEISRCYLENCTTGFTETQEKIFNGLLSSAKFSNTYSSFPKSWSQVQMSTQAGDKSNDEEEDDDVDDDFFELETPHDVNEDDSMSEQELSKYEVVSDDEPNELKPVCSESEGGKKRSSKFQNMSPMTKAIMDSVDVPVRKIMGKWVEEGNEVTRIEVSLTMLFLRKRKMYLKALQLSEWLESSKQIEFGNANYAARVDLIARVLGPARAEDYISKIPESCRSELVYRSLLANYVARSDLKKSVEVFNRMKKLGFPLTPFSCNKMLLLYLKADKKKIADILLLMEKENVKPSVFTYQVLINAKGQSNDIPGMEKVVEAMTAEGMEPSLQIQVALASHYANAGLKDKAEAILKQMEGDDLKKNRRVCQHLLPVYASIGMEDEVERIWNFCKPDAWLKECTAAIEALGKLNKIENAEAVFDKMLKMLKKPTSKQMMPLLNVYSDHKMLDKGKDLVKQMGDMGLSIGPPVWDALVRLYVGVGDVEKADLVLEKATKDKKGMFTSYFAILDNYARKGDVHNAEKIFSKMRKVGYAPRIRQYNALLQAYLNAKAPAYGFVERMRGDNLMPNAIIAKQLAQLNAVRKSEVSDLL